MKALILICFAVCLASQSPINSQTIDSNWPNWRGPKMDGVSPNGKPPITWSENQNIKWKIPMSGRGLSTPVVWGDQIFINTAIELEGKELKEALKRINSSRNQSEQAQQSSLNSDYIIQFKVISISLATGEVLWEKVVREQIPFNYIITTSSYASASCVTDGTNVIASFGSYGIYCFSMDGEQQWEKDFGIWEDPFAVGEGSTPFIYDDKVIIVWDHAGDSRIITLNKNTGSILWQKNRNEHHTWATPIVVNVDDTPQILVAGNNRSIGYDLNSGEELWHIKGLAESIIPSPVFDGTNVFFMTGGRNGMIQVVKINKAIGDLNNTESQLWTHNKNSSSVPSPVLVNGRFYFLRGSRAQISCIDAENGKTHFDAVRPKGMMGTYTSPVAANGYIYILDKKGLCSVIEEGVTFKLVQQNKLDDTFDASPAIAGDNLILKGSQFMYCISE